MNKGDFITYISKKHSTSKADAEKIIDMFTSSAMDALGDGNEIWLCCMNRCFDIFPLSPKYWFKRYA